MKNIIKVNDYKSIFSSQEHSELANIQKSGVKTSRQPKLEKQKENINNIQEYPSLFSPFKLESSHSNTILPFNHLSESDSFLKTPRKMPSKAQTDKIEAVSLDYEIAIPQTMNEIAQQKFQEPLILDKLPELKEDIAMESKMFKQFFETYLSCFLVENEYLKSKSIERFNLLLSFTIKEVSNFVVDRPVSNEILASFLVRFFKQFPSDQTPNFQNYLSKIWDKLSHKSGSSFDEIGASLCSNYFFGIILYTVTKYILREKDLFIYWWVQYVLDFQENADVELAKEELLRQFAVIKSYLSQSKNKVVKHF